MLTVVIGAPCSGKSTYVRDHAAPGDIVIDFDVMAQAMGSPVTHDHGAALRIVTVDARRAAIASAVQQHQRGATVWIVETDPSLRMQDYRRAGAEFVTMTADRDELHRRAEAERPARWHQLIDQHLAKAVTPPRARLRAGSGSC